MLTKLLRWNLRNPWHPEHLNPIIRRNVGPKSAVGPPWRGAPATYGNDTGLRVVPNLV
jgi:hypothetical protein